VCSHFSGWSTPSGFVTFTAKNRADPIPQSGVGASDFVGEQGGTMIIRPSRIASVIALGLASIGIGLVSLGAALVVSPGAAYADVGCVSSGTTTVTVTCPVGTADSWTVPSGVTEATFTVMGASGGSSFGTGGEGGELQATLAVDPGNTYFIEVGQAGADATTSTVGASGGVPGGGAGGAVCWLGCWVSGGGGGGASIVALGSTDPGDWQLVAGGGGGAGYGGVGGAGGGLSGGAGGGPVTGGDQDGSAGSGQQLYGQPGWLGGGGGGGGYWGGGGGFWGLPGGGGSGFITPSALSGSTFLASTNVGDGSITITYPASGECGYHTHHHHHGGSYDQQNGPHHHHHGEDCDAG
jgi:glycine rich protein